MGAMNPVYAFQPGNTPVLLSVPHSGTRMPQDIGDRLTPMACKMGDTDWYVDRLYNWANQLGVGVLTANYSRYVIDLNRPPDNAALYRGSGTGLLPEFSFAGEALYKVGYGLHAGEGEKRRAQFWQPYHDKLQTELQALQQAHGFAILLDAHSIRSEVPLLFDGKLPDLNLGSNRGESADSALVSACQAALTQNAAYSFVLDGRFRGGFITRHYGQPTDGMHALQLEMAQSVYMCEQRMVFDEARSADILPVLRALIKTLLNWSPSHA